MPDDHSEVVPLLPIPNRTVKRLSADDSADSRVKVGHCQALIAQKTHLKRMGFFISKNKVQILFVLTKYYPIDYFRRVNAYHQYGE